MADRSSVAVDRPAGGDRRADEREPSAAVRVAPVAVGVALAVGLGAWGLGRLSLWLDEATSVGATAQLGATFEGTAGTMAPYYLALDGWTALFGTSPTAVRSLSVLLIAVAVAVAAVVVRRLVRPLEAGLAVVVLGALPGFTRYAQEARSYALVAVITALGWICVERAVAADAAGAPTTARRWWRALAGVSLLGVAAHGLFPLQLAAMLGSLLLLPDRRRLLSAAAPALAVSFAAVVYLTTLGAADIATWIPPLHLGQLVDLGAELTAPSPLPAAVLGLLALVGTRTLVRRTDPDPVARWRTLVPLVWALGPPALLVLVSVPRPYLVPRYVIGSLPGMAVLVAVGAMAIARSGPHPARSRTIGTAVVLVAALAVGQVALHQRTSYDWTTAAAVVAEGARPGDALLISSPPLRMPFEAAWGQLDPAVVPESIWMPRPLGRVQRYDAMTTYSELDQAMAAFPRVWMVHQTTNGLQDQARERILDRPAIAGAFRITRHLHLDGGVQVLLLERT